MCATEDSPLGNWKHCQHYRTAGLLKTHPPQNRTKPRELAPLLSIDLWVSGYNFHGDLQSPGGDKLACLWDQYILINNH